MRRLRTLIAVAAVAALAASVPLWTGAASGTGIASVAPQQVTSFSFPDPDVTLFDGTYYMYATNGARNVPVATAASPAGPWTIRGDALPALGTWATAGKTWAPEVSRRTDGTYVMYYTARNVNPDLQCIGVATAASPLGPFTPVGTGPLVCPQADGGAIDASTYTENGARYLLYKTNANSLSPKKPPVLYLQRTSADGLTLTGSRTALLSHDPADEREGDIIEAPVLVKQGSRYVLFYSGGHFWDDTYFTSYATAGSLTGPYTKAAKPLITTESVDRTVIGPGGADIVRGVNGGVDSIMFHGHISGGRAVYRADLGWVNGFPVVRGSRVRVEAERGVLNHCSVRDASSSGASQGEVVAYIDHADSWVELSVHAAGAGDHTISVGYANGSQEGATHRLTVNGTAAGTVTYPYTGWGNWRQVTVDVDLKAGANTLRFTHGIAFAELDYIEYR